MNFKPNIQKGGRLVRAALGLLLLIAAIVISDPLLLRIALFISAAFVLFEAARGWCFLRACGIRTKF